MWTVISGIFGGLLRLAPEVLKMWDAKNERKHELDMQDKALEFQKLKGDQRVEEISTQGAADYNVDALGVLKTAIEGQDKPSGVAWVDAFSKLIRPLITLQWVIILYPGVIIWSFILLLQSNMPVTDALGRVFGEPEKALVAFIVDFWFIGRALRSK
jgi:hypothetical protein